MIKKLVLAFFKALLSFQKLFPLQAINGALKVSLNKQKVAKAGSSK